MRVMSQPRLQDGSHALEANAASAGLALGCAYSSSDEYEAEVIQTRRKAGANICEIALMAASIMPADVMPVVAAGKGGVYATGESLSSSVGTNPTI